MTLDNSKNAMLAHDDGGREIEAIVDHRYDGGDLEVRVMSLRI